MKKHVGNWYIHYKCYLYVYIIAILLWGIIMFLDVFSSIYNLFGIEREVLCILVFILLLVNCILVYILRKRYEQGTYFEINKKYIEVGKTSLYTFLKITQKAPLENILDYKIKQGLISKLYKVYIVNVNCGSEFLKLYVGEADIYCLKETFNKILENNLEYRRYKDEEH